MRRRPRQIQSSLGSRHSNASDRHPNPYIRNFRVFRLPWVSINKLSFGAGKPDSVPPRQSRNFSRHFSHAGLATSLSATARLRGRGGMRHTRGYRTGHPAAYFALHRKGFFVPPPSLVARWALTPPFHPYPLRISNLKSEISKRAVCSL